MANILLIDDDALLRDTTQQMLELDGHSVTAADDGDSGLREFRNGRKYDLVISDILMPKLDGARLIGELRAFTQTMPILAISGGRRSITANFSLETASLSGASLRLSKPFTRAELQAAVRQLLTA
jgi:CheY-like chemotaxis protein